MNFKASPKCPKCSESVYFNEKVAFNKQAWHKTCFKCASCSKSLEMGSASEHNDHPYCKNCYRKNVACQKFGWAQTWKGENGNRKEYKPHVREETRKVKEHIVVVRKKVVV